LNTQVHYYVYPDEGHSGWRPDNVLDYCLRADFFFHLQLDGRYDGRMPPLTTTAVAIHEEAYDVTCRVRGR
jgi:hypothetical protein